jgi:hypothetical protein
VAEADPIESAFLAGAITALRRRAARQARIAADKSNVNRRLQKLKGEKLVDVTLGLWAITPKGEKALKPVEK